MDVHLSDPHTARAFVIAQADAERRDDTPYPFIPEQPDAVEIARAEQGTVFVALYTETAAWVNFRATIPAARQLRDALDKALESE